MKYLVHFEKVGKKRPKIHLQKGQITTNWPQIIINISFMYFFTLLPLYFFTFTTYPPLGRQRMVEGNDAPSVMVHGLVP